MTQAPAAPRRRRPWSLQTRLMVTITAIVALILVGVALAISAFLGQILQENLNAKVQETASITAQNILRLDGGPGGQQPTAFDVLSAGRQEEGALLVLEDRDSSAMSGAVVLSNSVKALNDDQVAEVAGTITHPGLESVTITGLGEYRVYAYPLPNHIAVIGLPVNEVQKTIAQLFTAILIVTATGLVLLGIAIALIVRAGLKPLRAVADTATRVAALPMSEGSVSIDERVPAREADDRTEIGRVGHALNTLLDHVDASLDARQRNEDRMRRFVADASHELRTPLASIRGYSELSLRALRQAEASGGVPEPLVVETTGQSLERIQAQSLRMTTLVEDLLLLARLDEGQELVYGSVDLTRLAIEAVDDARPAGPDHEWVLEVGEDPVVIAGDTGRLHQVAANLLANARAHTPAGTTVTTTVLRDGKDAVLRVHDDGPGVDPAITAELFERFARADRSRARKTGGTGLGLSIAKAIVAAHGGTITAQSRPGDTTFEVRLPARPADPAG